MSTDIFGYNRQVIEKQIVSADNVSFDLGEGKISLVQSATIDYEHQIQPVFEVGSSSMFFVNGQPSGVMRFATLVGKEGFFHGLNLGNQACGTLNTISANIVDNSDGSCDIEVNKNNTLKVEGAILKSISLQIQAAGELRIAQGGVFQFAKLSRVS